MQKATTFESVGETKDHSNANSMVNGEYFSNVELIELQSVKQEQEEQIFDDIELGIPQQQMIQDIFVEEEDDDHSDT
eukprot:UN08256